MCIYDLYDYLYINAYCTVIYSCKGFNARTSN